MSYTIKIRRDTAANWTLHDPVLGNGEMGIVTDLTPQRIKIGDGATAFTLLPYFTLPNATTSVAGLMSASDKTKLDAYPSYSNLANYIVKNAGGMMSEGITLTMYVNAQTNQYVCNTGAATLPTAYTHNGEGYLYNRKAILTAGYNTIKLAYDDPTTIPSKAFSNVANIRNLRIPSWVHVIDTYAFKGTSITQVVCEGVCPPKIDASAFDDFHALTLYVPKVALVDYQAHSEWGTCGTVDAIENLY